MKQISFVIILCLEVFYASAQIEEPFSLTSCFVLQVNSKNIPFKTASGFFMKIDSTTFFITNNHVVGGETAKQEYLRIYKKAIPLDTIPNSLQIRTYSNQLNSFQFMTLPLFDGKDSTYILMWEDVKIKKGLMDVVAIPIPDTLRKYIGATKVLTESDIMPELRVPPSSELFIIGFPGEYGLNSLYPIWKKGTVASEPNVDKNSSGYWVDALTMGGMSGSPVLYRNQYYQAGGNSIMSIGTTPTFLLGIYSAQNYALSLGVVWKFDKVVAQLKNYKSK